MRILIPGAARLLPVFAWAALAVAAQSPEAANLPPQPVGPDDLLAIQVYGAPEFSRTVRVDAGGSIRLPMLPRAISVAGQLPAEVETAAALALAEAELLVNPVVTVTVVEYASRPVRVTGAVRRPVSFQAYGRVTLLDALNRAEGVTPEADAQLVVTRAPGVAGRPAAAVRVPLVALLDGSEPGLNLALTGGEEVHVPEAAQVFVVGNVKKPGAFRNSPRSPLTVLRALSLAEGLAPFARKQAYLYRRGPEGAATEVKIELGRILARKAPDIPLAPNDVLYVPDHTGRRIATQAIERAIGFGTATASGVLVLGSAR